MEDEVPDWPEISAAIKRAERQVRETKKRQVVYRRAGKIAAVSYAAYKRMELGTKGAERICTIG